MATDEQIKLKAGRYMVPVRCVTEVDKIWLKFNYNKKLLEEIKSMEGARWHPKVKFWSIMNNSRNKFQLSYLKGENPYAHYDQELIEYSSERPLYEHQIVMVRHGLTYHYVIFAAEMGTGKSLSAIEIMEYVKKHYGLEDYEAWYIGPKSGMVAFSLELEKWNSLVHPRMFTYERLVKYLKNWNNTEVLPKIIIPDECSKVKTPTAQRSQAVMWLADAVREEYGENGYVIEMSGTPAPKSPVDWWHQCEVACPGFIREGNIHKFKARLCLIEQRESNITGGVYPHVVTWFDDSNKCRICGRGKDDNCHTEFAQASGEGHEWVESINEVEKLYRRMRGLVLVQFKKDCLDLPEKQYEIVQLKPTVEMLRASKLIAKNSTRTIQALTLMRELADGFQYQDVEVDKETCPNCHGKRTIVINVPKEDIDVMAPQDINPEDFIEKEVTCDNCGGSGEVPKLARETAVVGTPKDKYFLEELDRHEDVGRYIVWGGFTGTIDRLVGLAKSRGWYILRVDGRGYHGFAPDGTSVINYHDLLIGMDRTHPKFRESFLKYPKLCFIGHPQAGGMALTLHASPTELFYSNCFNGEARMQAEDRAHRMGMDDNRGLTIKDLIVLPTDTLVLNNLKAKKKLQNISMGELRSALNE